MVFLSQWFPTSFCFVPRILLQSEPKQHRMPESCAAARTVHKSFRYRSRKNPLVSWMFECLLSKVYLYVFFSGPRFPSGSVYVYESDIVGRPTRWSLFLASSDTLVFILVYYIPSSSGHFFIFFRFQIYKVRNEYKNIFNIYKMLKGPNMCYISELQGVQGYQIRHSCVSSRSWRSWRTWRSWLS